MGPDNIHPRVLRDLADNVVRPLSTIFVKLCRPGDVTEDWKKTSVTLTYKKVLKENAGNYRTINLASILGRVVEQILRKALTSQMKHVTGKIQQGFTKGKSCLTNLTTLYDKVTCSVDVD